MPTLKSSLTASSLVVLLSATLAGCLPGGSSSSSSANNANGGSGGAAPPPPPTTPTLPEPGDIVARDSGETIDMVIGVGYLIANNDSLTVTSVDPAEMRVRFLFNEADADQQRQTQLLDGSAQLNYTND
ncbi:MAG: hypothetical protein EA348_05680 [Pseudomonadaceae bacterium]|nr:MAG: hypothetical protein EA348_05680 [Pseudomonadaceae bacterium]